MKIFTIQLTIQFLSNFPSASLLSEVLLQIKSLFRYDHAACRLYDKSVQIKIHCIFLTLWLEFESDASS